MSLDIRPSGELDFLSLGALVNRLDPGIVPFRKATHCDIHVSGGEFNVAANLADCFGMQTGVASAMVDYPVGDLIAVAATGAYCYAMASNYNRIPRPAVVAVSAGEPRVLLRRETEDDLMRLETW